MKNGMYKSCKVTADLVNVRLCMRSEESAYPSTSCDILTVEERKYENENVGSQVTDLETSLLPDQVRCIHARTALYRMRDRVVRASKRPENVGESLGCTVQLHRLGRKVQCTAFGHCSLPGVAAAQQPGRSVRSPAFSPPSPSLGFASMYVSLLEEKR